MSDQEDNESKRVEFDDEDEEESKPKSQPTMKDLFGSDSEDEEEEVEQTTVSYLEIPTVQPIPTKVSLFKLPPSLKIEPRAYTKEQILNRTDEEQYGENNFMRTTTLRWRVGENDKHESNSRIVKWNDGTLTMHVGDEVFHITTRETRNDHTHLYNQITDSIIYGQGKFSRRLAFQPSQKRMYQIQAAPQKKAQIDLVASKQETKLTFVAEDPEREAQQPIKKQTQALNSRRQKLAQKNARNAKKNLNSARLTDNFIEGSDAEDDDEDAEESSGNLRAIKKKMLGKRPARRQDSDEEDEEMEEEEEAPMTYDEEEDDDDDDDYRASARKRTRR